MLRSHRWRQKFAAKFDQLGRRLGSGPAVGVHGPFVALPFTAHTGEITSAGMGTHAQGDQLFVTGEHLQTLAGRPEHTIDIVDREVVVGELTCGRDGQQDER